jgi:hypothetical protein
MNGAVCISNIAGPNLAANHPKQLALACLEPAIGFVDYIYAAMATNHAVITVAALEGLKRIDNFHWENPLC